MSNKKGGHKTKIGGQALIEGVMMKGLHETAMAVRMPDGSIDVEKWENKPSKWYNKAPFIRGMVNFITSMKEGNSCLTKSADKSSEECTEEELSKFERWLYKVFGEKAYNVAMAGAMVFAVLIAVAGFMWLPAVLFSLFKGLFGDTDISGFRSLFEGVIKTVLLVLYLFAFSKLKDMKRLFEYHGAEHKTIACFEKGMELTPENVLTCTRFHPRCGTSFIFLVFIISVLVFSILPINSEMFVQWWGISEGLANIVRVFAKLLFMPLVVGISYELIRLAGRYDNIFTKIISAPGLALQRITTKEPDRTQVEVAIAAMTPVLPQAGEDDSW